MSDIIVIEGPQDGLVDEELADLLVAAGFAEVACWGDMQGVPFDPEVSPNLVVAARRK